MGTWLQSEKNHQSPGQPPYDFVTNESQLSPRCKRGESGDNDGKTITLIGINFSREGRNIVEWIEKIALETNSITLIIYKIPF